MAMDYDVVVVGGGLGGMTSAAYLCEYGYRTLLCEKAAKTGGLVNTFWHKGYAFDGGIRAFENSGILFPMLRRLGIEIAFEKNPVAIGIEQEWTKLGSLDSLEDYCQMLVRIFPDQSREVEEIRNAILKVMGYMDVIYGIDNPLFLENYNDLAYVTKELLPWLMKYQVNIRKASRLSEPVNDYLKKITKNSALIDMITQHFFKDTPTFFALSYFGLYLDYCYPKGGTGTLAVQMEQAIRQRGGEILTEAEVTQVETDKHRIHVAGKGVFGYQKMVWAADQNTLYECAVGQQTKAVQQQKALAKKHSGGDSILTVFLGLHADADRFRNTCGAHSFYTPSKKGLSSIESWQQAQQRGIEALFGWVDEYLKHTTYEISCPCLRDSTLAPQGCVGLIVSTLMDYELVRYMQQCGRYAEFKERCIETIVQGLDASMKLEIFEALDVSFCATPLTIERETGNSQGAITGWAFGSGQMPAENRFAKIANSVNTPIQDVVQCGQWTFSPSGLPISILTGKLAADAIRKKWKGAAR